MCRWRLAATLGVRAILRRRRWRQRLLRRALCAACRPSRRYQSGKSLAVTGSINQWGEVQAIGGVNEKIEGFFDVCRRVGSPSKQGVLIPRANVQHLMLREDVVEAVRHGQFSVYPVASIDEGIEILTGVKAGERDAEGRFPAGTINRLVEDKLQVLRGARPQLFQGWCRQRRRTGRHRMIAHVASSGEDSGRVVLQLGARTPSAIALRPRSALRKPSSRKSKASSSRTNSCSIAPSFSFVREVSLTGRWSRTVSREEMAFGLRLAANDARRQVEKLARQADVPLRSRVVRDEPLRAISVACAETGPWNVVALAEPLRRATAVS